MVSQPFFGAKFRVHENIGDFFVVQFTFDAPSKLSPISALDIKQC